MSTLRALRGSAAALLPKRKLRLNSTAARPPTNPEPLRSILIANRGEIALRVGRTASQYGIRTTTLYTDPDRLSQHANSSPFAINLGSTDQYLNGERIIQVAKENGCEAIHPGYGFLSENAAFAKACTDAGVKFIGPPWKAIEAMGDKSRSKEIMIAAGVPCIPGYHGAEQDPAYLAEQAEEVGYPVLLKAVKGGGGKGMRIARTAEEFAQQLDSAKSEARSSFGDDVMLVEKYITTPRHIEVQVFADQHGNCVALGERDCSIQRRHQKILEESPAPNLAESVRQDLWEKARQAALAVGYEGAGTVEFIFDNDSGEFFFMEMNTRLQVEHPVTEMVTGEDLVRWQIIVAEGGKLPLTQADVEERIKERGHAIEARIYAEDPSMNFVPSTGKLVHLRTPPLSEGVRIDAGFIEGDEVSSHYDPMIAKLIVSRPDRASALQKMAAALEQYEIAGVVTNIDFLKRCCRSPGFIAGEVETGYIDKHREELFAEQQITDDIYAQAAIGLFLSSQSAASTTAPLPSTQPLGFARTPQPHAVTLSPTSTDPNAPTPPTKTLYVLQTAPGIFSVTFPGSPQTFENLTTTFSPSTKTLTTYFPHTRLSSTLIATPPSATSASTITLFTRGTSYTLTLSPPPFLPKLLNSGPVASNSVKAPMPCKILRVMVKEGEEVKKGQALVVIESMKMETTIRSPGDAVVGRVKVREGEMCKAGTAVVEFEEEDGAEGTT
ncbi:hypothetical protein B0A48_08627 [Cryoendolithus antarcticus]|uniref:Methylcrotonoyl-CoA carboxylase subunit alpha, mitochondrial n=1 Tax=Cryoendolithus antarcticus TaxID=1507870 RepID=A0A1V8T3Z1_9PEZI|nr:hypothetical protein B0A48_08627 [Cryoendolithus antarcticus]